MPEPPVCVGTFEIGHLICDGDPNGDTEEQRVVCAWRNRCAGLQAYCAESGNHPEEVVAALSYERLVTLCEAKVEALDIREGVPGGRPDEAPAEPEDVPEIPHTKNGKARASTKRTRKGRKAPSVRDRKGDRKGAGKSKGELSEAMQALGAHFETGLRDHFPEREFASGKRVLVRAGIFYPVDRTEHSHYTSWYCTSRSGMDHAIACVRYKPRLGTVDIALPISVDDLRAFLGKRLFKKLQPKQYRNGQFRSLATKLDTEGVSIAVEVLKKLIEADLIALP